jgi:hypothetical protein
VGFLLGVAAWAALAAFVVVRELVAIRIRRPILQRWAENHGLKLRSARYRFRILRPYQYFRALVPFAIEVEDKTGHVTIGLAWIAGFVRRGVWIEWGRTERLR